jgi:DNA-binding response OmpR family regulator
VTATPSILAGQRVMEQSSILVLDKDPLQLDLTALLLKRDKHLPITTADPETAFRILQAQEIDLVLLDPSLPRHDGYRVGQQIRQMKPAVAIVVVSGQNDEEEVVRHLLAFADDFVGKPFAPRELLARVHSVLRRSGLANGVRGVDGSLVVGEISLNRHLMQISIRGRVIALTPRELSLLAILMTNPDRVLSRSQLVRLAWGHEFSGCLKTVDVCVQRLRRKMEPHVSGAGYIEAVRGFGYKLGQPQRPAITVARSPTLGGVAGAAI